MGWGKEWSLPPAKVGDEIIIINDTNQPLTIWPSGITVAPNERYQNKVPTHDPYSNPDSHIYYECACGAILDPGTKSFAQLNNAAMEKGWKVRFGVEYYIPYCVKCGEGVE